MTNEITLKPEKVKVKALNAKSVRGDFEFEKGKTEVTFVVETKELKGFCRLFLVQEDVSNPVLDDVGEVSVETVRPGK